MRDLKNLLTLQSRLRTIREQNKKMKEMNNERDDATTTESQGDELIMNEISTTAKDLTTSFQEAFMALSDATENSGGDPKKVTDEDRERFRKIFSELELKLNINKYKLKRRIETSPKLRSEAYRRYGESKYEQGSDEQGTSGFTKKTKRSGK